MKKLKKIAAAVAVMTIPLSGMAAVVTQQFNSTALAPLFGSQGNVWTTPDGFITVESTGGAIHIGANALGVAGPTQAVQLYQQLNNNESLRFTFAAPVTDVTFGRSAGTFPINLTSYDALGDVVFSASRVFPNSLPSSTVVNGPDNTPILSFFLQGVVGTGAGIASITYTTIEASQVPLPATGLLFVAGLALMAGLRREKSKAA